MVLPITMVELARTSNSPKTAQRSYKSETAANKLALLMYIFDLSEVIGNIGANILPCRAAHLVVRTA
jgi:hypothetical protein